MAMEAGTLIDVDGYPWSNRLWRDAEAHVFAVPTDDERPWRVIDFPGRSGPGSQHEHSAHRGANQAGRFWESSPWLLTRDATLAASTNAWLQEMVSREAA